MEVEGAVRKAKELCGHDPAVIAEHDQRGFERQHLRDGIWLAQARRRQDRGDAKGGRRICDRSPSRREAASGRPRRRRDGTDEIDGRVDRQRTERGKPEAAAADEDRPHRPVLCEDRGRSAEPVGPWTHARALVASRTSASSSLPSPTARSSSIESR